MRKLFFLLRSATMKARVLAIVALVLGVAFIVSLAAGFNSAMKSPITELPIISMIAGEEDLTGDIDEVFLEARLELERIRLAASPEKLEAFEKEYGMSLEELEELLETPSLDSLVKILEISLELSLEEELENMEGYDEVMSESEEVVAAIESAVKTAETVGIIFMVLLALSLVFLRKWLLNLIYLVTIPVCLIFMGVKTLVIGTILVVAYNVLTSMAAEMNANLAMEG